MPMMIVLMIVTEKVSFRHLHWCDVRSATRMNRERDSIRRAALYLSLAERKQRDLYRKRQETARGEAKGDNHRGKRGN